MEILIFHFSYKPSLKIGQQILKRRSANRQFGSFQQMRILHMHLQWLSERHRQLL